MIALVVSAVLVVLAAAVSHFARSRWPRIALASALLIFQVVTLAIAFDVRARAVLTAERQAASARPAWDVVREVRDAQLVDRMSVGLVGLGLFILAAVNRRPLEVRNPREIDQTAQ